MDAHLRRRVWPPFRTDAQAGVQLPEPIRGYQVRRRVNRRDWFLIPLTIENPVFSSQWLKTGFYDFEPTGEQWGNGVPPRGAEIFLCTNLSISE